MSPDDVVLSYATSLGDLEPLGLDNLVRSIRSKPASGSLYWQGLLFRNADDSIADPVRARGLPGQTWTAMPRAGTVWQVKAPPSYTLRFQVKPVDYDPIFKIAQGLNRGNCTILDRDIWAGLTDWEASEDWPRYRDIVTTMKTLGYDVGAETWSITENGNRIMPADWVPPHVSALDAGGLRLKDFRRANVEGLFELKQYGDRRKVEDVFNETLQEGWDGLVLKDFYNMSSRKAERIYFVVFDRTAIKRHILNVPCGGIDSDFWFDIFHGHKPEAEAWSPVYDHRRNNSWRPFIDVTEALDSASATYPPDPPRHVYTVPRIVEEHYATVTEDLLLTKLLDYEEGEYLDAEYDQVEKLYLVARNSEGDLLAYLTVIGGEIRKLGGTDTPPSKDCVNSLAPFFRSQGWSRDSRSTWLGWVVDSKGRWHPCGSLPEGLTVIGDLDFSPLSRPDDPLPDWATFLDLPKRLRVIGNLNLRSLPITELPEEMMVSGDLILSRTKLESLPLDITVGGTLDISDTSISFLPPDLNVPGCLDISSTQIKFLPDGLSVTGSMSIRHTEIDVLPDDLQVLGTLYTYKSRLADTISHPRVGQIDRELKYGMTNEELEDIPF